MDIILNELISKTEAYDTLRLSTDLSDDDFYELIDEALGEFYTIPLNLIQSADDIADRGKRKKIKTFFNDDDCPITFYEGPVHTYNMPDILTSLVLNVKLDERNSDYLHIKTKLIKENTENFFSEIEGSITLIYQISTRYIRGHRLYDEDIQKIETQIDIWNKKTETQKGMNDSFTYNLIMNRT